MLRHDEIREACRYCGCPGLHGRVDECLAALERLIAKTKTEIAAAQSHMPTKERPVKPLRRGTGYSFRRKKEI